MYLIRTHLSSEWNLWIKFGSAALFHWLITWLHQRPQVADAASNQKISKILERNKNDLPLKPGEQAQW